jgi:hypothetical protein
MSAAPDAMSQHPPLLRRGHLISDSLHRPSSGPATTTVGSVCGVVFLFDSSASASDCHFDLLPVTTTTQSSSLGSTSFGEFFLTPTPQIVGLSHWCHPVPFPLRPCHQFARILAGAATPPPWGEPLSIFCYFASRPTAHGWPASLVVLGQC